MTDNFKKFIIFTFYLYFYKTLIFLKNKSQKLFQKLKNSIPNNHLSSIWIRIVNVKDVQRNNSPK